MYKEIKKCPELIYYTNWINKHKPLQSVYNYNKIYEEETIKYRQFFDEVNKAITESYKENKYE